MIMICRSLLHTYRDSYSNTFGIVMGHVECVVRRHSVNINM